MYTLNRSWSSSAHNLKGMIFLMVRTELIQSKDYSFKMAYQLRSAMLFLEVGVLTTFKQNLKEVKVNHAQCSDVVHNILVGSEKSFKLLKKTLLLLDNVESTSILKGEGSAMAAQLKSSQVLCFNALAQMEHCIKRVQVYVSRCAEVEYWRTAVRMSHFVSPRDHCAESLPNTRNTESFYLLQDFWWSVDVVQLATVCLKKLLTTVVDAKFQYDAFKWCKGKCRLVLKDGGGGECDYTVLKEENKEDKICLHHKANLVDSDKEKLLRQLKMKGGNNLTWFPSRGRNHERRLKMFLKQVLEGPAVRVGYLPSTLKIDYHDIKLSDRLLGQGSFGVILEGQWHGETVAVKYIKLGDDFEIKKQLLEKEVALLASLHHHNIVRFIGFTYDEETKNCVIVMERMQMNLRSLIKHNLDLISKGLASGSVPRFLEKHSLFPLDVTIDLLQIVEGMCHLRDFRVMHRDLRAENILVNRCAQVGSTVSKVPVATKLREFERGYFYHVKLADFGTSKSQMEDSEFCTKGKGTIKWMAPEVLEATFEREDDTLYYSWPADVYSFGITCSEILTGGLPFQDASGRKLLDLILAGVRPPLPADCPKSLKGLICECWDTDPLLRPNFWEVRQRLWCCKLKMFLYQKGKISVCQTYYNNVQRFISDSILECGRAKSGAKGQYYIRTIFTNMLQHGYKQEAAPEMIKNRDLELVEKVLKKYTTVLKCYTVEEIEMALNVFNTTLNPGSRSKLGLKPMNSVDYDKMCPGQMADGSLVAIKCMHYTLDEDINLIGEVLWCGTTVHRNILQLVGFCLPLGSGLAVLCLVYPYTTNGSVASQLRELVYGKPALSFKIRKRIALETAQVLFYLHGHMFYRNVNTGNVMLNEKFEALLVYEGGMLPENPGTPHWEDFAFMLLELVTGQKHSLFNARKLLREDKINLLVVPALGDNFDRKDVADLWQAALLCCKQSPSDFRRNMEEITALLKGTFL